jgi:hypothetical protein
MKRTAAAITMLAGLSGLGGCVAPNTVQTPNRAGHARDVQGVVGPWGQPVPAAANGNAALSGTVVPAAVRGVSDDDKGVLQTGGFTPGGPGAMPGGPGPMPGGEASKSGSQGLFAKRAERKRTGQVPPPPSAGPPGAVLPGGLPMMGTARSSVRFVGQDGMQIGWFAPTPDGRAAFRDQLNTPARYNFLQGGIYRLKLSNIPKRANLELYPTIEVVPQNPKTSTFLAHSAIPVSFTDDDFEQVTSGNFVIKVVYLPDPAFQELATGLPDEVVSTKLEPGVDPIQEAQRRGSVLMIVRMGNIDLEAPNTPAMDAGNPYLRPPMPPMPPQGPAPRSAPGGGGSGPKPLGELPLPKPPGSVILP